MQAGWAHVANDFNFETSGALRGKFGRDVAKGKRYAGVMRVSTRGDPTNNFSIMEDGFVTNHVRRPCWVDVHFEHHQLAGGAGFHFGFHCRTTDEIVVELHSPIHAGLERCVDGAVLAVPSSEVLFQTHGDERAETEQAHVEFFSGFPDQVEQVTLVFGCNPDFVTEVTGVCHSRQPHWRIADVDPTECHEREVLRGKRCVGQLLQYVA